MFFWFYYYFYLGGQKTGARFGEVAQNQPNSFDRPSIKPSLAKSLVTPF
jgi:hypothetical protein